MRISDWSSDVCSSDLAPVGALGRAFAGKHADRVFAAAPVRIHAAGVRIVAEIGRASCRERVCQYVSISVVAVSLKKKTISPSTNITTATGRHLYYTTSAVLSSPRSDTYDTHTA